MMAGAEDRLLEARQLLGELGFDAERRNERSALVLLALLELQPSAPWKDASGPLIRTVEIMDWLRSVYGKDYKPNTRETIRRQTLHQFEDAGLIVRNPDEPARPVNSPRTCYQVDAAALRVIRALGTSTYEAALGAYLTDRPGLVALYARERDQEMVPVKLPDGSAVELTPGGQNVLIGEILQNFCPRWTPGGQVLYVGDAGKDDPVYEEEVLAALGVELDKHGKFPDLMVHLADRDWLVLLEAASSHGPVDAKRYRELHGLFGSASPGLVLVSCFPSRAEMRKYLDQLAWETEVWCADAPSHLIHFNGERFLGPYESEV